MKITAAFFSYVFSAAVLASAQAMGRPYVTMLTKASPRSPAGAVYFITNGPEENMLVSAAINNDGTLRLDRAVATSGRGIHGETATGNTGTDPLFSQGSVQVAAKANLLATVNSASNTISLFKIDPRRPTVITPFGDPISTGGDFPLSVSFTSDGRRLCALNGGAVNGVNCFSVNSKLGLVAVPNTLRYIGLNQTNPPFGPPGTLSQIRFTEDDSKLLVSYKGGNSPGYFLTWDVAKDGSLSANYTQINIAGAMVPFSLTPIPGQNAFLVADPGIGFDIVDFSGKGRNAAISIPSNNATCWSTYSPKTGNYYTIDVAVNTIREVQLDSNLKGNVVASYTVAFGTSTIDPEVATVRGRDYLYVLGAASEVIDVFALNGPGQAKHIATVDIAGPARDSGVTLTMGNLQGMATYVRSGYY